MGLRFGIVVVRGLAQLKVDRAVLQVEVFPSIVQMLRIKDTGEFCTL